MSILIWINPSQCTLIIPAVGYLLKPQCAIPLLACIIYEVLEYLRTKSLQYVRQIAVLIVAVVVVFISVNSSVLLELIKRGVNFNDDSKIGITHYLMMGMNQTEDGGYSKEDVKFSVSIASAKERSAANVQVFKASIQEAGIGGLDNHLRKKIMNSYNEGGFGWGYEGVFYKNMSELPNQTVAPLSVISMTLIGIFLWMLLFECRARYAYIFVPLYCVLVGIGLENLQNSIFPSSINNHKNICST